MTFAKSQESSYSTRFYVIFAWPAIHSTTHKISLYAMIQTINPAPGRRGTIPYNTSIQNSKAAKGRKAVWLAIDNGGLWKVFEASAIWLVYITSRLEPEFANQSKISDA